MIDVCVGEVDTCRWSSLATASAAVSSGQLFMMNLLVHSLMDDHVGLELALESTFRHEVQVPPVCLSVNLDHSCMIMFQCLSTFC